MGSGHDMASPSCHAVALGGIPAALMHTCAALPPQESVNLLNRHHLALFNMEQTHLWLAFWCDFIGALLVVATCLLRYGARQGVCAHAVQVVRCQQCMKLCMHWPPAD